MYFSLQNGRIALIVASYKSHADCVMLFKHGAKVDFQDILSAVLCSLV